MNPPASVFFKYFAAWLAMSGVLLSLLLIAEGAYGFVVERFTRGASGVSSVKTLFLAFRAPFLLPATTARTAAVYFPALAIAALLPIPACIPFFNFMPLLGNSGDLLQIVQFSLMSETFALLAIWSLGTEQSKQAGMELFLESAGLLLSFAACFVSLSFYLSANGILGDTFSLNLFTDSLHIGSFGIYGRIAVALFVFLVLAQAPYCATCSTASSFYALQMPEYDGPQRGLLQLWASLRVFVAISLITHIFFPWAFLKEAEFAVGGQWWMQAFHFALFWFSVVAVRVLLVPLCRKVLDLLSARFSKPGALLFSLLIVVLAMALMYLETYFSSMEAF